jgi:hypothetical protein
MVVIANETAGNKNLCSLHYRHCERSEAIFILHFLKGKGMVGSAHSTFREGRLASCFCRDDREESRNNSFTVRKEEKENESKN